jgi:DNA-binding CsgD family transcriptional regulator
MQDPGKPAGRVGGDRVSPVARKLTSEREAQILELRLRKVPFVKIAATLGMTPRAVSKAYERALRRVPTRRAQELIIEELETLDRIDARIWREIEKRMEDNKNLYRGMQVLLEVQQRRAKLLGLDAARQLNISILKPADDKGVTTLAQQEEALTRLSPEEKEQLLMLLSKMSASVERKG